MTVHATRIDASSEVQHLTFPTSSKYFGFYGSAFKRLLDVTLVLIAVPFLAPFFVIIGVVIFSKDRHSPFFLQERIGRNGKRFRMWKFRTMVPNAEAQLQRHLDENPKARAEWDSKQKLASDPRCTKIGKLLRRSSMDELPQLLNVLMGDMSLVGPRPMMPDQQALYPGQGYYRLRPGMTGSWQVSARSASTFAARAGYDDTYEQSLSFSNDVSIVAKTVGVVLRGTGV
ncbi:sugar transferase [Rhodobacteraceae bacterium]|nr:sugar transferase [Paracoccaceae bacterium]